MTLTEFLSLAYKSRWTGTQIDNGLEPIIDGTLDRKIAQAAEAETAAQTSASAAAKSAQESKDAETAVTAAQNEVETMKAEVQADKNMAVAARDEACGYMDFASESASTAVIAKNAAETAKVAAETAKDEAQTAKNAAAKSAASIADSEAVAIAAKEDIQTMQAALHNRRRILIGTAADVERLMPGDTLIITDDSSVAHTTDYQDLTLEAQKAAAGEVNTLDDIAVLSAVNATNLRRTADGLLWTTDTVADFRAKLTAFAGAAVSAGYVDANGRCIATWAQAQACLITGALLTPLDAEAEDYPWRKAAPKTEYDAIKERLGAIEAQLLQASDRTNTLINGGNLT